MNEKDLMAKQLLEMREASKSLLHSANAFFTKDAKWCSSEIIIDIETCNNCVTDEKMKKWSDMIEKIRESLREYMLWRKETNTKTDEDDAAVHAFQKLLFHFDNLKVVIEGMKYNEEHKEVWKTLNAWVDELAEQGVVTADAKIFEHVLDFGGNKYGLIDLGYSRDDNGDRVMISTALRVGDEIGAFVHIYGIYFKADKTAEAEHAYDKLVPTCVIDDGWRPLECFWL